MEVTFCGCKISVSPIFMSAVTLMLIFDKTGMFIFVVLSAGIHETGHIIALWLFGNYPRRISLNPFSLEIIPAHPPSGIFQEISVSFGGAAANLTASGIFLPLGFSLKEPFLTAVAASNTALCIFNLLPLNCLDGGDILMIFATAIFGGKRAVFLCKTVSLCISLAGIIAGIIIIFRLQKPAFLIFSIYALTISSLMKRPMRR